MQSIDLGRLYKFQHKAIEFYAAMYDIMDYLIS